MDISDFSYDDFRMVHAVFNATLKTIEAMFGAPATLMKDSKPYIIYYTLNSLCLELYDAENQAALANKLKKANEHQEPDS